MRHFNRKCRKIRKLLLFDYDFFIIKSEQKWGIICRKAKAAPPKRQKTPRALRGAPKKYRLLLFFLYDKNGEGRVVFAV